MLNIIFYDSVIFNGLKKVEICKFIVADKEFFAFRIPYQVICIFAIISAIAYECNLVDFIA